MFKIYALFCLNTFSLISFSYGNDKENAEITSFYYAEDAEKKFHHYFKCGEDLGISKKALLIEGHRLANHVIKASKTVSSSIKNYYYNEFLFHCEFYVECLGAKEKKGGKLFWSLYQDLFPAPVIPYPPALKQPSKKEDEIPLLSPGSDHSKTE